MLSRFWCLVFGILLLVGCSGSNAAPDTSDSLPEASATAVSTDSAAADDGPVTPSATAPPTEPSEEESAPETTLTVPPADTDSTSVPPLEPYDGDEAPANVAADSTSAWISRRSMTASSIEVVWSAPEGAVDYQIHRLTRTTDQEPDVSEMTADNLVHSGENQGVFLDVDVTPDISYWHGVRGLDADGNVVSLGWHPTVAITDEQPPEAVDLSLEQDDGSVLLSWTAPAENYQLHSYRIRRAVDGGEAEVMATTWNLDQTSFLDDSPPNAVIVYSVEATDFHWNRSEPAEVTVDLS